MHDEKNDKKFDVLLFLYILFITLLHHYHNLTNRFHSKLNIDIKFINWWHFIWLGQSITPEQFNHDQCIATTIYIFRYIYTYIHNTVEVFKCHDYLAEHLLKS